MATGIVVFAKDLTSMARFYAEVTGLPAVTTDPGHVTVGPTVTVVAIPAELAASIEITDPPLRRESSAVKPVLDVASIESLRTTLPALGGAVDPPDRAWRLADATICDGHDPEGNVVQFRQVG